jgi:hypothetical protein
MFNPIVTKGKSPGGGSTRAGYQKSQQMLAKKMDNLAASNINQTTDGMYKFMIFALDLGEARKKQSKLPKTLDDFKHKICDSLGVDSDDQRVEAIFAGYQGVGRVALDTDEQFKEFMSSVDSKPEQEVVVQEESPLVQELRAEIASLRRDKERSEALWLKEKANLNDQIAIQEKRLNELTKQIEEQRQQFQRKLLKVQEEKRAVERELEKAKQEIEKLKDQLQKVSAVYEEKMREQREKFDEEKRRLMATIKHQKEEIARKDELIAQLEEQVATLKERVEQLEAQVEEQKQKIAELEKENRKLTVLTKQQKRINDELQAKYEDVRAKLAKYEETAPMVIEEPDPLRFEWVIPGMRAKLEKWERGRAIHSPEFCLESVDDMMIEFFPRGDSTSYDGFCAVKIRVPDNTKIRWSFQIGEILGGPRCDHYERHLWWNRSGVVWNNFCTEYDLERQIDENDQLTCVFQLHVIPEGEKLQDPVELGRDPFAHRSAQLPVLRSQSEAELSTGEKLLNPLYYRHEDLPGGASSSLFNGKVSIEREQSPLTSRGASPLASVGSRATTRASSRKVLGASRVDKLRNRSAPSGPGQLTRKGPNAAGMAQTWDESAWKGQRDALPPVPVSRRGMSPSPVG